MGINFFEKKGKFDFNNNYCFVTSRFQRQSLNFFKYTN